MKYLKEIDFDNLQKEFHILNENFVFELIGNNESSINFNVYERMSSSTYQDNIKPPDKVEIYLTGKIKWDGCSHIWQVNEDEKDNEYKHICGLAEWKNYLNMMEELYKYAMSLMDRVDESEVWTEEGLEYA